METRSKQSRVARPEAVALAEDAERSLPFSTILLLVVANLIPLLGVLFSGWKLGEVMGLFWAESVVMGFYTLIKIAVVTRWEALFYGIVFLWTFGFWTAVQFQFLYGLFVRGIHAPGPAADTFEALTSLFLPLWPVLLLLFMIHGASFVLNFLAQGQYEGETWGRLALVPQLRMILMQFTITLGGLGVTLLNSQLPALVLLVAFKLWLDLKLMEAASNSLRKSD